MSFCYVRDTVSALLKMITNGRARGEVFNFGNPNEVRIIELAHIIKRQTDSNSMITFHPPPEDPRRRRPNTSKAKRILGWEPRVELAEGLRRTIEWFRNKAKP